ncbi:DUF4129 domain-containing protein [Mycobacterium botniense]|uniref:Membrane protein n=1 Tax=Mycobacterium botniense TaxID=84962 RepID=A0A7I9XWF5_9MYCO|nr:DUF4129 domain-containing protein [Mycobacterium botniense]GFG74122.1 membrane protein [Mycobacterium botniense]
MPAIDIDRNAAHEAAKHELAKAIYPKDSPRQLVRDWVEDLLYRLALKGSSVPGGWLAITAVLTALAIAVVAGIRVARRTMHTHRNTDLQLFDTNLLSAAQHRTSAESHAAAGNWTAAIRHRVRAVARELEERNILNPAPGRTASELARDAGTSLPDLSPELVTAAMVFNDVTYGGRRGTPEEYQMIVNLDDHLRTRSPATPPEVVHPAESGSWAQVE